MEKYIETEIVLLLPGLEATFVWNFIGIGSVVFPWLNHRWANRTNPFYIDDLLIVKHIYEKVEGYNKVKNTHTVLTI